MIAVTRSMPSPDIASLPERLKELREARGLTQTRMAGLLGVSLRVYHRWENGHAMPHFDTVVKIADLLQVSLDELAGRKESTSEARIRNHELHQLYQQADQLSDEEQRALMVLMDSLMKRSQIDRIMGAKRASPRTAAKSKAGLAA
jgi:transcriptional regulator with XRE-family HTH domain